MVINVFSCTTNINSSLFDSDISVIRLLDVMSYFNNGFKLLVTE